jgi:hypothetical protein
MIVELSKYGSLILYTLKRVGFIYYHVVFDRVLIEIFHPQHVN